MTGNIHHTIRILRLVFSLNLLSLASSSQDTSSVHLLLRQIHDQQVQHDPFFMPGIFPSYVSNKSVYKEQRKDNNVFFNAVISYTLKTLRPKLSAMDQVIVDSIISRSERLTGRFKNGKGRESYNFWRTDSAYRLPYLWGLRIKKKHLLDDDQDCTSMCLLSFTTSSDAAQKAHSIMQGHVNNTGSHAFTIHPRYRSYTAYTTWLGKKLPPVLDVCVISNVLSFVQSNKLQWSKADSASLDYIIATLKNKDHINNALQVAPFYGTTSIIYYHLARLMSIKPIPGLEVMKDALIREAREQLKQSTNEFEKIILSNALMKWNADTNIAVDIRRNEIEKNDLPFFIGNIPSIFHHVLQKPLSKKGIAIYYHYCPAYNNVLLLEFLVLKSENTAGFAIGKTQ